MESIMDTGLAFIPAILLAVFGIWLFHWIVEKRIVVPTNLVHIVQSGKKTTSYGAAQAANSYYAWPDWIPIIGVKVIILPISVFRVELEGYAAYDKGRLPFVLDVLAFFRVSDPSKAAERISSTEELVDQLMGIMQGVVRTILANEELETILGERAKFSGLFTEEVREQLPQWGIEAVKSIELMDIRDGAQSQVIANIMAKKKSYIEMESRTEVAKNMQAASVAEITAQQAVKTREQEALEQVGIRTAEKDQRVGISTQQAQQAIQEETKNTAVKQMAVQEVNQVRAAEIARGVAVVQAEQSKEVAKVTAEGVKLRTVTEAEGALSAAKLSAEGLSATGKAKGEAEQAILMAPVNTQITLAKEIGENQGYQTYLISVRQIEATQAVGIAQAGALENADVKIFANTGTPADGVTSVRDLFSARGGLALGAMAEGLKATETGEKILSAVTGGKK